MPRACCRMARRSMVPWICEGVGVGPEPVRADPHREADDLRAGPCASTIRICPRCAPSCATARADDYRFEDGHANRDSDPFQKRERRAATAIAHKTQLPWSSSLRRPMHFITKKHLSRRTMLRGAGVSLGPAATGRHDSCGNRARQHGRGAGPRMGFVYFPHGAMMSRLGARADRQRLRDLAHPEAAGAFRDHMTIVSGLRNKAGESPRPHAIIAGTWLACVAPAGGQAPKAGTSADQIAAQAHRTGHDRCRRLELAGEDGGGACDPRSAARTPGTIAFRHRRSRCRWSNNPREVFFRMFGLGDTAEQRHAIAAETGSVLDYVRGIRQGHAARVWIPPTAHGERLSRLGARGGAPCTEDDSEREARA